MEYFLIFFKTLDGNGNIANGMSLVKAKDFEDACNKIIEQNNPTASQFEDMTIK